MTPADGPAGAPRTPGGTGARVWPSANEYSQAIQNPSTAFDEPGLCGASPALDRLGMPLVMSGNFAYVFKLLLANGGARGVKCFRRLLPDRERRFRAIDEELGRVRVPYFASFEYDVTGVRVAGEWYPTLVMEWISGPTLDVYIDQLIGRGASREPILSLARQWIDLVAGLEDVGIAHGDLQHGNVLVTSSGLRLVDLDGMFVPALAGQGAPDEVGHRHFQHPQRRVRDFDARLDRFSALVVHVTLLALAEEPGLWREFHDDNLLFLRRDFEDPSSSPLFPRIERLPGDAGRLATVLRAACGGPLDAVPPLTGLVAASRSKLPLWLREPDVVVVVAPTREAKLQEETSVPVVSVDGEGPLSRGDANGAWQMPAVTSGGLRLAPLVASSPPPVPRRTRSASPSAAVGASAASQGPAPSLLPTSPPYPPVQAGLLSGVVIACAGLLAICLWYPLLAQFVERAFGVQTSSGRSTTFVLALYAVLTFSAGFALMAFRRRRILAALKRGPVPIPPTAASWSAAAVRQGVARVLGGAAPPQQPPSFLQQSAPSSPVFVCGVPKPQGGGAAAVLASQLRSEFHRPGCAAAQRIGQSTRRWYFGSGDAARDGYVPCSVCRP